eukprot:8680494-Lingulodinium_polyedra.AAC.1
MPDIDQDTPTCLPWPSGRVVGRRRWRSARRGRRQQRAFGYGQGDALPPLPAWLREIPASS